jgi:RHS repeat-associated protein
MVDRVFTYHPTGSLQNKFDAGNFEYNSNPYRPSSNQYEQISSPSIANQSLSENQSILYNHFNKVLNIIQNDKELNIIYGLNENRINTNVKINNSVVYDAYYINSANMEIVNGNENTYIYAGDQPVAIFNSTTSNLYYLHLDVMGSLTTITDISGNVVERRNYDPWGRPRNPNTLEYSLNNPFGSNTTLSTLRGFTFHEHLDWFDLINMNGRMFDTHLSQFLNADPFITDYTNSQTFNRYSYVSNNPLKYTDPTGYIGSNPNSGPSSNIASNGSSIASWNSFLKNSSFSKITISELMGEFFNFPEEPLIKKSGASVNGNRNMGLAQVGNHTPYYQLNWAQGDGGSVFSSAVPFALTAAAADGPIPIGDVVGAVILAGATAYDATQRTFVTYTLRNAAGQVYVGRTSGYGDPYRIMMKRVSGHHMKALGYGNPILDRAVQGYQGYPAIRGREQQLIDFYGGVGSPKVGNSIRGVGYYNFEGPALHGLSNMFFGTLAPYTGFWK